MALARLTGVAQLMGLALDWGCRSCILQISCKQKTAVGCRSSLFPTQTRTVQTRRRLALIGRPGRALSV
jgi:hypothetical protein